MRLLTTSFTAIVASISPFILADQADDAKAVFQRMATASKQLNYEGRFVYNRDGKMDTMHIIHANDNGGGFEQITSLNGMSWKVISKGDKVFCPFPGKSGKGLQHNKLRNLTNLKPRNKLKALNKHYDFKLLGKERVAGRMCRVITIVPKDQFRYGYQLWIDIDSGLLLRTDVVNAMGKTIEQMMFTSIKFYQEIPKFPLLGDLKANKSSSQGAPLASVEAANQVKSKQSQGPRQVQWSMELPPGFFLAEHDQGQDQREVFEHMVYTDGIASISVFIQKHSTESQKLKQAVTQGAINAMAIHKDNFGHVTVVGEVPQATVRKIANTLRHTGK